ncbi:MAG: TlpA family protein disulfide reductase [Myxococcota bacterium]
MVYVKPDNAVCRRVVATLERVQRGLPFELVQTDVSNDPALLEKYADNLPVVMIDDEQAFTGSISESAFRKAMKRAKSRAKAGRGKSPGSDTSAREPIQVDALEFEEKASLRVPVPAMAAILFAVVFGVGYFLYEGIAEAQYGRGRLARQLLDIKSKQEAPPSFALEEFKGPRITSDERFRGKVVFLNFWATWCPPCVEEMPSMIRLQAKMASEPRFEMLTISTDEEWAPVRKFFDEGPPFDVLLDKGGKIAKDYGTTKFPETYIIVDGRLVGHIVGPRDWDTWYAETYLRSVSRYGLAL